MAAIFMSRRAKHAHSIASVEKTVSVQSFQELLTAAAAGKALDSWNGMKLLVMEPKTGKILVNAGADQPHDPASLTKIPGFYVIQEAIRGGKLKLDEMLTVPDLTYQKVEGKKRRTEHLQATHLTRGHSLTVSELLDAMMIKSDNGAAQMLVSEVGRRLGKDPIDLLNQKAKELGLKASHFINAGGLPPDQDPDHSKKDGPKTTTAHDIATLMQRVHKDFPEAMARHMTKAAATYDGHTLPANHFLLAENSPLKLPEGYQVAAKTGFVNSGHNIATMITAPDKRQLVVVVLGAAKRWSPEVVRQTGLMNDAMLKKSITGSDVHGNRVRDALVHQLTLEYIGGKSPGIAVKPTTVESSKPPAAVASASASTSAAPAHPAAPAASVSVPPSKNSALSVDQKVIEAAAATHATQKLPPSALKAVHECRRTIDKYSRPGPESEAKIDVPKQPVQLSQEEAYLAGLEAQLKQARTLKTKKALQHEIGTLKETIAVERNFIGTLNGIENQANPSIYTQANYDNQLARAKFYTDAFVDAWEGALPPGGKQALKQKFHAIVEGSAGKETGWSPDIVKSGANRRPHTGVFQTAWPFIADAKKAIDATPSMQAVIAKYPEDIAVLNLPFRAISQEYSNNQLSDKVRQALLKREIKKIEKFSTTSFAGQGAAFAGMTVASFIQHLKAGGKPEEFNGERLYQEHMMGGYGAREFRDQLASAPNSKGDPGISRSTYNGNYLQPSNPYSPLNDLNPNRTVFAEATASQVQQMMRDKSIHARNRMEKKGVNPERILAFEQAFLPEWSGNPVLKAQDIARVAYQKELGKQLRDVAEETLKAHAAEYQQKGKKVPESVKDEVLCTILRPMPKPPQTVTPRIG